VSFDELYTTWIWRPIAHCPGRFVLVAPHRSVTVAELVGSQARHREYRVPTARDVVVVVAIDGGGIISYRRASGVYVHTLNTSDGFQRKLTQLGIPDCHHARGDH
jgi:hypothetical protein